ncbi:hypothetical protein HanIR_Chr17g0855221 [Helianthus annuus]|nr:hypothetical protein HanIR_Chr17g0855221 [Helianthus annuus]
MGSDCRFTTVNPTSRSQLHHRTIPDGSLRIGHLNSTGTVRLLAPNGTPYWIPDVDDDPEESAYIQESEQTLRRSTRPEVRKSTNPTYYS